MKYLISLLVLTIFVTKVSFGQNDDTIRLKKSYEERKKMIVTDRPPQAWYFELGGSGLIFSAHYDRRFGKRAGGPGWAGGFGLWFGGGATIVTVPVSLNYLVGRRNNFLELAGGTTFATGAFDFGDDREHGSGFFHHVSAGFRYQPAAGGFFFRIGFSPIFFDGLTVMWYYLGGGISF